MNRLLRLATLFSLSLAAACSADLTNRSGGGGGGGGGGSEEDTTPRETERPDDTSAEPDGTTGGGGDQDTAVIVDDTGTTLDIGVDDTSDTGTIIIDTGTADTGTLDTTCVTEGAACESDADSTDTMICLADVDGSLACRTRCNADTADNTGSSDCPLRSWCLDAGATDSTLTGACIPGDCATNIFDATACGGTGTCLPVGNGASFCIDAGDAGEGDPCNRSTAATPPASDICAPGLLCVSGTCEQPCNRANGNADCTGGQNCLAAVDATSTNRPGLCGTSCTAFSQGTCPSGTACEPMIGRAGLTAWMCREQAGTNEFANGEVCDDTGHCAEGFLCLASETDASGNTISRCQEFCDTQDMIDGNPTCGGDACAPSGVNGLGLCFQACTPFPRQPTGDYGCTGSTDGCFPVVASDSEPLAPYGACEPGDTGTLAVGRSCATSGTIGECADLALCFDTTDDTTDNPVCQALCEPLTHDATACSGRATCSPLLPLVGNGSFGTCDPNYVSGAVGARCATEGSPCDADGTLCLDITGSGATCVPICREGFAEDCASLPGTTCTVGVFDPTVVPAFMGVCN